MDTLYGGGRIRPMRVGAEAAEALLERDGRVVAVGGRDEVESLAAPGARRVDLRGATLLPGLIDTHPHLLHFAALEAPLVPIWDARSHGEIVERIRLRATDTAAGEWIMTTPVGEPHYFLRRSWRDLAEGRLPDRHVLDRATSAHPVLIQAWAPVTPNVCALNSAGLALLGVTRETPDRVDDVFVEKDGSGEPTGLLRGRVNNYYSGSSFWESLQRRIPFLQLAHVLPAVERAMATAHQSGVTAVYEGHAMGAGEIAAYRALRAQDKLRIRVLTALEAEPYGLPWSTPQSDAEFDAQLRAAHAARQVDDAWLRHDGVTLSRGGPCWPGFLRTHEPYRGPFGEPTTGVTFVSGEKEERAIAFCAEHGVRLNFIGAGPRDHDEFLPRAEAAVAAHPALRDAHWILQHAFFVSEDQARRYAALGFDVTTSLSFCWGKGDLFVERGLGSLLPDLTPLARLLSAGLRVAAGSDWGPKNPWEQIELATTHRFASGHRNDGAAQRVSREAALSMWTSAAADVLGWPEIGRLAPGAHADLAIVERDPLTCAGDALASMRVLRTVVGGEVVWDAGEVREA
jgi:hypothetical protein